MCVCLLVCVGVTTLCLRVALLLHILLPTATATIQLAMAAVSSPSLADHMRGCSHRPHHTHPTDTCHSLLLLQRWYARDEVTGLAGPAVQGAVASLSLDMLAALQEEEACNPPHQLQLWSAEDPKLYILVLRLSGTNGALLEAEAVRVCVCVWLCASMITFARAAR